MEENPSAAVTPPHSRSTQTGFPRRYGVGTLLVITAMYALLFGLLRSLDAHPLVFCAVSLYVTGIGVAQPILFRGRRPREASILAGAAMAVLMWVIFVVVVLVRGDVEPRNDNAVPLFAPLLPAIGAIWGYLIGCLIGGIFVVMNLVHKRPPEEQDEETEARQSPFAASPPPTAGQQNE